ncbi:hypothetical protein FVF58_26610 [Paraburkholderia panacisoli]|uniref:Uncharacterized protein n=1 Tax=Paraburkholderia panacisoli TaxID=2603818 RepID=A0A5B0GTC1_9BURK|nr:hypothetical protein FVF58_26610 [Paraburkholderia panacisoli]
MKAGQLATQQESLQDSGYLRALAPKMTVADLSARVASAFFVWPKELLDTEGCGGRAVARCRGGSESGRGCAGRNEAPIHRRHRRPTSPVGRLIRPLGLGQCIDPAPEACG